MNRPWVITVLCVVVGIICLQLLMVIVAMLMMEGITPSGQLLLLKLIGTFGFDFFAIIGYWMMKRWGLFSYLIGALIGNPSLFTLQWHGNLYHYVILIVFIAIGIFYWKRMR